MNREQQEEKAIQYALGTMPRDETAVFESALKSDRELQNIVHDYQVINEVDAEETEQMDPPFALYSRIMGTIDVDQGQVVDSPIEERKVVPIWPWLGWVVAACVAVVLGLNSWSGRSVGVASANDDIMLSDLGKPNAVDLVVNEDTKEDGLESRMIELADLAEAYWFSRNGMPAEEREAVTADAPTGGFTIFDSKHKIGFIGVENLPPEKRGKAFHVWAKAQAGERPMRAGLLRGGENSRGLFFFDLSQSGEVDEFASGVVSFFVTEETEELPESPSDQIVLSGI